MMVKSLLQYSTTQPSAAKAFPASATLSFLTKIQSVSLRICSTPSVKHSSEIDDSDQPSRNQEDRDACYLKGLGKVCCDTCEICRTGEFRQSVIRSHQPTHEAALVPEHGGNHTDPHTRQSLLAIPSPTEHSVSGRRQLAHRPGWRSH